MTSSLDESRDLLVGTPGSGVRSLPLVCGTTLLSLSFLGHGPGTVTLVTRTNPL